MEDTIDLNENKMLTEEKPETFTSPELKQEDGTIKKKKHTSRKPKKINANVTEPIQNPNPQVCSETLETLPITELKPIEESTLPCSNETVRIQNLCSEPLEASPITELKPIEESTCPDSNMTVPIKNSNPQVCSEPLEASPITQLKPNEESTLPDSNSTPKKKRKRGKKKNVLDSQEAQPQLIPQPLSQSQSQPVSQPVSEPEPEPKGHGNAELNDRKTNEEEKGEESNGTKPSLDIALPTIEIENKQEAGPIQVYAEGATTPTGKKKKRRKSKRKKMDEAAVENQTNVLHLENAVNHDQIQMNITDTEHKEMMHKSVLDGEKCNEHNVKQLDSAVQRPRELVAEPSTDLTIVIDSHPATPVDTEQKIVKKSKIEGNAELNDKKKNEEKQGEESNETKPSFDIAVSTIEIEKKQEAEPIQVSADGATTPTGKKKKKPKSKRKKMDKAAVAVENQTNLLHLENAVNHDQNQMKTTETEHKEKRHRSVLDGEQFNEHNVKPLDTAVQRPMELVTEPSIDPIESECHIEAPPTDPTILIDPHPSTPIEAEQKIVKKSKIEGNAELNDKKKNEEKQGEESNETKPSFDIAVSTIEIEKKQEAEPIQVSADGATTPTGKKKKKPKSKRKKMDKAAVAVENQTNLLHLENAVNHDQNQMKTTETEHKEKRHRSVLDGEQFNEHNVKPLDTAVQRPMELVTEPSVDPIECHIEAPPTDPTILIDPHPATPIDAEQKIVKKSRKRKRKGGLKSDGEAKPNENNGEPHETLVQKLTGPVTALSTIQMDPNRETDVQRPMEPVTEPSTDPINPECHIEAPSTDAIILMDPHPATPIVAEQNSVKKSRKRKRKGGLKSDGEGKPNEHIGEPRESLVLKPIGPVTAPSTIPTDPHTSSPIDSEQKKPKKRKKSKKRKGGPKSGEGLPNEVNGLNGKQPEISVQNSIDPITAPSVAPTVPIDPAIPKDPHPATLVNPEQKTSTTKSKNKSEKKVKEKKKTPKKVEWWKWKLEAKLAARVPVEVDKLQYHPFYHLGPNFTTCWACRQPDHTIKECKKLRHVSENAEICFFCGEIGHSLKKCSVSLAGGGRLARCLFCHAHGHFSYKCPGNSHVPTSEGVVDGGS